MAHGRAPSDHQASPATVPAARPAAAGLVEVAALDASIRTDVRYSTPANFMGRPLYPPGVPVMLQRPAAESLPKVAAALRPRGLGLLLFDGYRPWRVTKAMWDETAPEKRKFVASPERGSNHNRGCAIDLSLYDLATGREVEMPSAYDEMSPRAYGAYAGGTPVQREMRDLLKSEMRRAGWSPIRNEWWHFDWRDSDAYGVLDIPFPEPRPAAARPILKR